MIHIFTDGSCSGNNQKDMSKRRAGWATVFMGDHAHLSTSGKLDASTSLITNNVAELTAIQTALRIVKEQHFTRDGHTVHLHTDSDYSKNCLRRDAPRWQRNGWKRRDGPIKNLDLIKSCYGLLKELGPKMTVSWTKAHTGGGSFEAKGNALADAEANKARDL